MRFKNEESLKAVLTELTHGMRERISWEIHEEMNRFMRELESKLYEHFIKLKDKHMVEIMKSFETIVATHTDGTIEVVFGIKATK